MMPFEHLNATSVEDTLAALGDDWQTRIIAGGTDLLPLMKERIIAPSRLVNIKEAPELARLDFDPDDGLVLGALATLDEVARNPAVRQKYRVLAEAIDVAASPQLRNMATLVGNLLQTSRCWYYRGPFFCWLKGGDSCCAATGENRLHALFGGGPCFSAHPSDPAPALVSLGAQLTIHDREGNSRSVPLEEFYALPTENRRRETTLGPGELVVEGRIPPQSPEARGSYLKAMAREAWAFALVGVAVHGVWEGPMAREINVVLGGVAPIPWRARGAEDLVRGKPLDGNLARQAGEAAVAGARPLQQNGYKVELVRTLVERALLMASAPKGRRHTAA